MKTRTNAGRLKYILMGMLMLLCLGTVYSWSVFRKPLEEHFQVGSTQSGLPFMLFLAAYAFLMPVGGILMQKYKPRTVILIGGVLVGTGWFLSGYATHMISLALTYGVLAGGGVGIVYGVPLAVVAKWYPEKKGIAVGMTLLGFGLSPFLTAPIARWLIELYSPLITFRIFGVAFLLVIILLSIPFKYPDGDGGRSKSRLEAIRNDTVEIATREMFAEKRFYGLWLCFVISTMSGLMSIGIAGAVGVEIIALDASDAAWTVSLFAVFNGVGRPIFGGLADRIGPYKTSLITYALMIVAALLMITASEGSVGRYLAAFCILWLTLGGWLAIAPTSTLIFFGQQHYSKNYGFVFTAYGVGAILGVFSSGLIRDALGSYLYVFYLLIILGVSGLVVSTTLLRNKDGVVASR